MNKNTLNLNQLLNYMQATDFLCTMVVPHPLLLTYLGFLETALPLRLTSPWQHHYAAKASIFLARVQEPLQIADIREELTRDNYKEKFHKLLCWEEKAHIEALEKK